MSAAVYFPMRTCRKCNKPKPVAGSKIMRIGFVCRDCIPKVIT